MHKLFTTFIIVLLLQAPMMAQDKSDPSTEFANLKSSFETYSMEKNVYKDLKETAQFIDEFLTKVKFEYLSSCKHNMLPRVICKYDSIPISTSALLYNGNKADTIYFDSGVWIISDTIPNEMNFNLLCFDRGINVKNRLANKLANDIKMKHMVTIKENPGSLYFVAADSLYYAAISSKRIPAFKILSNSPLLNYATCLKTILNASGLDVTYDDIIHNYLSTVIDDERVPMVGCDGVIGGHRIETIFIPKECCNVSEIVEELIRERFMIVIDRGGNASLLTAISMRKETDYEPTAVRIRIPSLDDGQQRKQIDWTDFVNGLATLVKVNIY